MEILSLRLLAGGRVSRDSSVERLFVEYSLLDLPTEETPLSLPKPPQGQTINYNYSKGEAARGGRPPHVAAATPRGTCKAEPGFEVSPAGITAALFTVVPVDAENNGGRRRLLRAVLEGNNPQMER